MAWKELEKSSSGFQLLSDTAERGVVGTGPLGEGLPRLFTEAL